MTFDEVLDQVRELLQRKGRLSYQALKLRFDIDDSFLEGLKGELIKAERVAADEEGEVLVWIGDSSVPSSGFRVSSSTHPLAPNTQPLTYRPLSTHRERFTATTGCHWAGVSSEPDATRCLPTRGGTLPSVILVATQRVSLRAARVS
jgi:hypothetical protein